jgi:hypothetical protein
MEMRRLKQRSGFARGRIGAGRFPEQAKEA